MTPTVTLAGRPYRGWTSVRVQRSLEQAAGSLTVTLSDRAGADGPRLDLRPGAAVAVDLDGDRLLTGWIDSVRVRHDAGSHEIEASGRDAACDLVDCSAPSSPGEWRDAGLGEIASAIAAPYGVPVRAPAPGAPLARFRIEEGETAYEAIERACRMRGLLPMSDPAGGLVLGRPARQRAAVALRHGVNVLAASAEATARDRYAEYRVLGQQPSSDLLGGDVAAHVAATAVDEGVDRPRRLTLLAEQALSDAEARQRAEWEASVRAARSRRAAVRVAGWREHGDRGPLWAPGALVRVVDDWLGLDRDLLVTSVTWLAGPDGAVCDLGLVPADAYDPAPRPAPRRPAATAGADAEWDLWT